MQVYDTVQRFAEWCAHWAGEHPGSEFSRDYHNNSKVLYDDGWLRVIHVRLGAFDHGAGNCILVAQGYKAWVAYEGDIKLFAQGDELVTQHDEILGGWL